MASLNSPRTTADMEEILKTAAERAIRYVQMARERKVAPAEKDLAALTTFHEPFPAEGSNPADVVAMLDEFDAVIPEVGGMLQPLHAVYRKHCANAIASLEASGEKQLTANANAVNARRVGELELRALDPELSSFFNVNTPEDYQRALKLAGFGK